jgi:signal transduction histidine kinase
VTDALRAADLNSRWALVYVLLGATSSICILALLAFILFRSTLRPVNRLAQVARQMARGSRVTVPSLDREDEIGELGRALSSAQEAAAERVALLEAMAVETGRHLLRMAAMNEISLAVVHGGGGRSALTVLVEHAADKARADYVQLLVPTGKGEFEIEFASGPAQDQMAGVEVSMSRSLAGMAYRSGETVTSSDASHDLRASRASARRLNAGPVVVSPIAGPDRVKGVLVAIRQVGRPEFQAAEIQLLDTFAAQASLALEYESLQRACRTLAQIEERERIAKDLQDGVIQSLFGIGIGLQAAASMEPTSPLGQRLAVAVKELDLTITRMRDLVFGLRPDQSADTSLYGNEAPAIAAGELNS